jgi:hypothetical protein
MRSWWFELVVSADGLKISVFTAWSLQLRSRPGIETGTSEISLDALAGVISKAPKLAINSKVRSLPMFGHKLSSPGPMLRWD